MGHRGGAPNLSLGLVATLHRNVPLLVAIGYLSVVVAALIACAITALVSGSSQTIWETLQFGVGECLFILRMPIWALFGSGTPPAQTIFVLPFLLPFFFRSVYVPKAWGWYLLALVLSVSQFAVVFPSSGAPAGNLSWTLIPVFIATAESVACSFVVAVFQWSRGQTSWLDRWFLLVVGRFVS
jgi:hypothetical protein